MNGFAFAISCPSCGSAVEPVTIGKVCGGTEARAVVRCTACHPRIAEFVVEVFLRRVADRTIEEPCGSEAAYHRHIKRGEAVDEACRDAHRRYQNPDQTGNRHGNRTAGVELLRTRMAHLEAVAEAKALV